MDEYERIQMRDKSVEIERLNRELAYQTKLLEETQGRLESLNADYDRITKTFQENEDYRRVEQENLERGCCGATTIHNRWIQSMIYELADLKRDLLKAQTALDVMKAEQEP